MSGIVHDRAICAVLPITRNAKADGASGSLASTRVSTPTSLWVVAGLAMAPAVAVGLARFAYALLLPPMRADLGWTYADAGTMSAANAAGYLAGALLAAAVDSRLGVKRAFMVSIFITAAMVGASGLTPHFGMLIALRFAAGAAGAVAFVTGGSLAAAAASGGGPGRASTVLGLYFGGVGMGIFVSALSVPPLLAAAGWQAGWLSLGAIALIAGLLAVPALSRAPNPDRPPARNEPGEEWSARFMMHSLAAYALFGAGYIAYATFIIAYVRSVEAFTQAEVSSFWALLGASAIIAAFVWGPILSRLKGGRGVAATIAMVTVGAALPLIWSSPSVAFLSAFLFGSSFLAVAAAVTSFARGVAPPHHWTAAIGTLTAAFGVGQCAGPVLSGALSDGPDGVRLGLWLSVGILAAAATVAMFQSEQKLHAK